MTVSGSLRRVVLAGGGTAGHIEPALNTADAIMRGFPDAHIVMVGTERGLETRLVPQRGYDLALIPAVPMPRKPSADLLNLGPRVRAAVRAARGVVRGADVVIGFGGYVALPVYLAARAEHVPIVVHEANAKPGLANRVGARFTKYVADAVPGSIAKARTLGIPIRRNIATLDRAALRASARRTYGLELERPTMLVFGGSQGAQHLNEVLGAARDELLASGVQILHAVGDRNEVPPARPGYVPVSYIDRMDEAYAAADLALCRAGAMTCAELAAVGLPGLYVPLPIGNGEQRLNALPVVRAGGGMVVEDALFTREWLVMNATELIRDTARLDAMGSAAAQYGVRNADEALVALAIQAVEGQ